ncbi:hypothetical protein MLD38_039177 [Melastoma candidum]|uniref:Uncharacterized protein n=1 Tax=Melastoma candidum TaxID=119954 RepID=A0ACB9L197_9MYRT|nr:hypothetical protein MLD38_039177 [Melastoma candidum]
MGNVNGREDGIDEEAGGDGVGSAPDGMSALDEPLGGEMMGGQSPPQSPRATQSPLMFTPQLPVARLQRLDEMHVSTHSLMETSSSYDDACNEQGIPTMITWSHGGKEVAAEGSWDNWKTSVHLQRSGKDFPLMKVLPSAYNILDLQDFVPEDLESIAGFELPPSPASSYNSLFLGSEDYAKEPPVVPPHLQLTLLNVHSVQMEIPPPFS